MPASATHYLFGEDVLHQLPVPALLAAVADHHAAFAWGLQGPDLLFCKNKFSRMPSPVPDYGQTMHAYKTDELFKAMTSYIIESKTQENHSILLSYLTGFICHYCLDRAGHPYVFFFQKYRGDKLPPNKRGGIHNRIESDIDSEMHLLKRGAHISHLDYAKAYASDEATKTSIAKLYSHLLQSVYAIDIAYEKLMSCFDEEIAWMSILVSNSKPKLLCMLVADFLSGKGNRLKKYHKSDRAQDDVMNFSGVIWHNLWHENERRRDNFLQLYEEAIEDAVAMNEEVYEQMRDDKPFEPQGLASFIDGNPDNKGRKGF